MNIRSLVACVAFAACAAQLSVAEAAAEPIEFDSSVGYAAFSGTLSDDQLMVDENGTFYRPSAYGCGYVYAEMPSFPWAFSVPSGRTLTILPRRVVRAASLSGVGEVVLNESSFLAVSSANGFAGRITIKPKATAVLPPALKDLVTIQEGGNVVYQTGEVTANQTLVLRVQATLESTLEKCPVLVRLSKSAMPGFRPEAAFFGGGFFSGSGVPYVTAMAEDTDEEYPCEVEKWSVDGDSFVWVQLPTMTTGTKVRLLLGRPSGLAPADTWRRGTTTDAAGDYIGVWHMNEKNGNVEDATARGLTAEPYSDATTPGYRGSVAGVGPVGNSRRISESYTSSGPRLRVANGPNLNHGSRFTVSCWAKEAASQQYARLLSRKTGYQAAGWEIQDATNARNGTFRQYAGKGTVQAEAKVSDKLIWHRYVFVYDHTSLKAYVDGSFSGEATVAEANVATDEDLPLAIGAGANTEWSLNGWMDEVRLLKDVVTADWVKADYESQNPDSMFWAVDSITDAEDADVLGGVTALPCKDTLFVKADVRCPAGATRTVKAEILDASGAVVATKTTDVSASGLTSLTFEFTGLNDRSAYRVRLTTNDGGTAKSEVQSAFVAHANQVLWQGPTSGVAEWTNTAHWVGGIVPGAEDCAVFGDDIETLSITNTATSSAKLTLYFKNMTVNSGTITFEKAPNTSYILNRATNLFTIASGAKVVWEPGYNPSSTKDIVSLHVAGGGTFQGPKYGGAKFGSSDYKSYLREFRAKEGSTIRFPGHGSYIGWYVAEKDALIAIESISSVQGQEIFEAERGGTITISNSSSNNNPGGLRGEGTINLTASGKNYKINNVKGPNSFGGTLIHTGSDTVFSDTVDVEKNRVIVASTNAFEQVATLKPKETRFDFAPGLGNFFFGKIAGIPSNPMVTEDQEGNPIKLYTKGIDAGTYLTGSGSWYNTAAATVTGDQVRVAGKIDSTARITFTNDASIIGNETRLGEHFTVAPGSTITFSGTNTDVYRYWGANKGLESNLTLPLKEGVYPTSSQGSSIVVEDNAVLRLGSVNSYPKMPSFTLRNGGTLFLMQRDGGWSSSDSEETSTATVDGGVFEVSSYSCVYYARLLKADDAAKWTCRVGPGGMTLRVRGVWATLYDGGKEYTFTWPIRSESNVPNGKDGGLTLDGMGTVSISREQALTGPINLFDGAIYIGADALSESSGVPLGTGDLIFGGGELKDTTAFDGVRQFACGDGSKVLLSGAGHFMMTNAVKFGALDRTRGGVLFVDTKTLDGEAASIKVTGAVATDTNGRTVVPIVYTKGMNTLDFMKYDNEKGLLPFETSDYADGLGNGASSIALVKQDVTSAADKKVPQNTTKEVRALKIEKTTSWDYQGVTIEKGATLKVGDGTNPGVVLLYGNVSQSNNGYSPIVGEGALDFGTSEGVIVVPKRAHLFYSPYSQVKARLSGQNGITFASVPSIECPSGGAQIRLSGDNDFEGGALLENVSVAAISATALGKDKVTVRGGHWHGATVEFTTADTTYANDFKIRGNGYFLMNRYVDPVATSFRYDAAGALRLGKPGVKLTGDIEIDEFARITSMYNNPGTPPELSGVISGGSLQFYKSPDLPIALSGQNTYTGGTRIISSKIILRDGTLGTGPVELDNSTLRFENTKAAVLANDLRGNGDLELAGTGEVSFTGDTSDYAPTTVDLCGGKRTFSSFPAFMTKFVNSGATRATIVLPPNLGRVKWNGATIDAATAARLDFDIGLGTLLDLDGASLTFHRGLNGSVERMVNGTVNELKPETGLVLIVR